jgi:hypothetical protein
MTLATVAFKNMNKIWIRKDKIRLTNKIRLYNAYIKPIITYNSGTWALTKHQTEKLNAFHRKQLRSMANIHYPNRITNDKLYNICNTEQLSIQITSSRWELLGHIARLHEDTPARQAMQHYFEETPNRGFRGRQRTTLPSIIEEDINRLRKPKTHMKDHTYGNTKTTDTPKELRDHNYTKTTELPKSLQTKQDLQQIIQLAQNREIFKQTKHKIVQAYKQTICTTTQ